MSILVKNKYKLTLCVLIIFSFLILRFQFQFFQYVFGSKIWVHRVNSIEKLEFIDDDFVGVELDVVYNNDLDVLDIYHPPEKSKNLFLKTYLEKDNKRHKYWLDFKNFSKKDQDKVISKLNSLVKTFQLNKSNIIVESTNSKLLPKFSTHNYITSYYLPANLLRLNKDELKEKTKIIRDNIHNNPTNFVSANYRDYYIIKKEFPDKDIITWIIDDNPEIYSYSTLRKALSKFKYRFKVFSDKKVKVVLVKSNFFKKPVEN